MDLEKAIEDAIRTGEVKLGSRETKKSIKTNNSELIILAKNCPREITSEISELAQEKGIKVIETNYNNYELGKISGRPHSVASISIIDPGNSKIIGSQKVGELNE